MENRSSELLRSCAAALQSTLFSTLSAAPDKRSRIFNAKASLPPSRESFGAMRRSLG
jgi:hypothetical protein